MPCGRAPHHTHTHKPIIGRQSHMNTKTAGIYTLGCKVNQYESQAIKESLEERGIKVLPFSEPCDAYIINSCAVTEESTRKTRQMIRRAVRRNPEAFVIVTGCAAQLQAERIADITGVDFICGTKNKMEAADAAVAMLSGKHSSGAGRISIPNADSGFEPMHIRHFERVRAYVKIQDGCNSNCAYCIIPKLRGDVCSKPRCDVVDEVRALAESGCSEVVLTGIETSAYSYDLPKLIAEINALSGIKRIRLGSLDPSFMKPRVVDAIAESEKAAHHFHLSMQSGCSRTLASMRRKYNADMALENMAYIRKVMPDVNFSTDLMTGFPGETEEDFAKTLEFTKKAEFLHVHVFPFSVRPGTEAADMPDQVPENIKNERAARLASLQSETSEQILCRELRAGNIGAVLAESCRGGRIKGHTSNFIETEVISDIKVAPGEIVRARPIRIENGIMISEII